MHGPESKPGGLMFIPITVGAAFAIKKVRHVFMRDCLSQLTLSSQYFAIFELFYLKNNEDIKLKAVSPEETLRMAIQGGPFYILFC
jgi:hypothetical protein